MSAEPQLPVGSSAKVVVGDDLYTGRIGQVVAPPEGPDEFDVYLHFSGDPSDTVNAYFHREVQAVPSAESTAPTPPASFWVGDRVRVIAKHDRRVWKVGSVVALGEGTQSGQYLLQFDDDPGRGQDGARHHHRSRPSPAMGPHHLLR